MVLENALLSFFHMQLAVFSASLTEEAIFSPFYILTSFVKDKVPIGAWVYLWAFCLVLLVYITVLVPIPYCFNDYSFVVQSEVKKVDSSSSILLFQDCFGYFGSFVFSYKLGNFFLQFYEKYHWQFHRYLIESEITLCSIVIFTIFILPIQKHGIAFHLLVSSLVFFISVLQF